MKFSGFVPSFEIVTGANGTALVLFFHLHVLHSFSCLPFGAEICFVRSVCLSGVHVNVAGHASVYFSAKGSSIPRLALIRQSARAFGIDKIIIIR